MTDDLIIGGQLGNYLIESVIGRGGMSVVYRAKHSRLGTSVALKVLAPELSSDDSFRERFLHEAQMAAGIDHPNVVPIHDVGLRENSLYIVMRYVAGGDLKALLAISGPLEAPRALALLMPVALALDAAHAHGLVHRDVKPGNILIQRSGGGEVEHVYLTDFGIAKSSSITGLTRAGGLIGTVEYMPPEQIEGHGVSAQTDVYALAGVFYECITGRIPFERELAEGVFPPAGSLEPVSTVRPELPPALDGVIAKALSRNPAERYSTCEQFLRACSYVLEARTSSVGGVAGSTVAETPPAQETVGAGTERSTGGTASDHEHVVAAGADPWPPASPPAPPSQPPPPPSQPLPPAAGKPGRGPGGVRWRPWHAAALAALVAAAVATVLLSSSSSSPKPLGQLSSSALGEVPTNHVTGIGKATIRLNGNVATVTLTTTGLDNNDVLAHALHIHAGGKGECPPASAAQSHNGHLTISTTDGINYYGPPALALTTYGDTTTSSILAFPRYPTGGTLRYSRTITIPQPLAAYIRQNNAVAVVHGIDYDHSGIYSGVLERSELNKSVPATATAPALCGQLVGTQTAALNPSARRRPLVYTATLVAESAAQSLLTSGLFACEAPPATAVAQKRREGVTKATVQGTAEA